MVVDRYAIQGAVKTCLTIGVFRLSVVHEFRVFLPLLENQALLIPRAVGATSKNGANP